MLPDIRRLLLLAVAIVALLPGLAQASFLPPDLVDKAADILAIVVLILVPIGAAVVFWLIHILPEVVAEKRYHPQKDAVQTLCLLSLLFGGLLWPLAWIVAYTKPVGYRRAYGTDKHDDYFRDMARDAKAGKLSREAIIGIKDELDAIAASNGLSTALKGVRAELEAVLAAADADTSARSAAK